MTEPTFGRTSVTGLYNFTFTKANSTISGCQVRRTPVFLAFTVLPFVSIALNGFVLCALAAHRKKLRHSRVYLYVANTLAANVIFSLLSLYQIVSLYFALNGYGHREPDQQGMVRDDVRLWWAFYR